MFATLIQAGHPRSELPGYTARQLSLYYREALGLSARARADRIEEIAIALAGNVAEVCADLRAWK